MPTPTSEPNIDSRPRGRLRGWRTPRTVVLILATVIGVEGLFRLVPETPDANTGPVASLFVNPRSHAARLEFLDQELLPRYEHPPRVAILGSSTAVLGIVPGELDRRLDLPPRSTVNLGLIGGGRPYDALLIYRRYRQLLRDVDLVLLSIDDFTLSEAHAPGELFRSFAPLGDRLAHAPRVVPSLLDSVFTLRRKIPNLPSQLATVFHWKQAEALGLEVNAQDQVRFAHWTDHPARDLAARQEEIIDRYYREFAVDEHALAILGELATLAKEDGARLVLLQIPSHPDFRRAVQEQHGALYAESWSRLHAFGRDRGVSLGRFESAAACGLDRHDYHDPVHLGQRGATIFTAFLGSWILQNGWLPGPK